MGIEFRTVGTLDVRFVVEGYQRGFRWGRGETWRLLDDVYDHAQHRDPHAAAGDYCLQPLVVAARGEAFEVIDGQQRLTTLFLLFESLRDLAGVGTGSPFTIRYTTPRNGGAEWLALPTEPREPRDADEFHVQEAARTIGEWLREKGDTELQRCTVASELRRCLDESVKVIWYLVPDADHESAVATFRRLNAGRILMTNAELVKAELLDAEPTEGSVALPQARDARYRAQLELATEWDRVESELRHPELWGFLTAHAPERFPSRIDLVLNVVAGFDGDGDPFRPYFWFKDQLVHRPAREVWSEITRCFATLRSWYDDPELYHLLGFLVACEVPTQRTRRGVALLRELWKSARSQRKSEFREEVRERVQGALKLRADQLGTVHYRHGADNAPAQRALLLFNVVSSMGAAAPTASTSERRAARPWYRFPFWAYHQEHWTLEHVHAQHAQALTQREQWRAWIEEHARVVASVPDERERAELRALLDVDPATLTLAQFGGLAIAVLGRLGDVSTQGDTGPVHGLGNLALVGGNLNSKLGNSAFAAKRRRVIEAAREGTLVPLCTQRLFLKYYSGDSVHQVHFWGRADQQSYLGAIREALRPFLLPGGAS